MQTLCNQDLLSFLDDTTREELFFLVSKLQTISSKIYIVGGTVRDFLLKKPFSGDIDIEIYGSNIVLLEQLAQDLGAIGVGKSFFVFKWKNFDIALPRQETKIAKGYRGFEVSIVDDEKIASQRRDFTINALMFDVQTCTICDYWGGLLDLQNQKIKAVSEQSFIEDSLRVMRGIRFSAQLGFRIDEQTLLLMNTIMLDDLNLERYNQELFKISFASFGYLALFYLYKLHIFEKLFHVKLDFCMLLKMVRAINFVKKNNLNINKDELFFYLIKYYCKLDSLAQVLGYSKIVKLIDAIPIIDSDIDDFTLLSIGVNQPINTFLGCLHTKIMNRAQYYNIWNTPLLLPFTAKEICEEGFGGIAIKNEYNRRKIKFLYDKIEGN